MPKKILLADDSITIQKVVELTFSDGDYEVTAVNNGAKAIQKLAEMRPDIILSDIIMPEKNGYEVCEFVKSHPEFRNIPIILLTGTFEPFDPDRAEKAGCDAVVTKPFESQSLIHKVEELIAQATPSSAPVEAPPPEETWATGPAEPAGWDESPQTGSQPEAPAAWGEPAADLFAAAPPTVEVPYTAPSIESGPPATSPFAREFDSDAAAPAEPASSSSPWDEQPAYSGETRTFQKMSFDDFEKTPAPEPAAMPEPQQQDFESPFGAPPPAEEFSGETRAFTKLSFDDLARMSGESSAAAPEPAIAPEPPAPAPEAAPEAAPWQEEVPPAAPEPSSWGAPPPQPAPWEEPPAYSGETRAFQKMSFEDFDQTASEPAPPPEVPLWQDEPQPLQEPAVSSSGFMHDDPQPAAAASVEPQRENLPWSEQAEPAWVDEPKAGDSNFGMPEPAAANQFGDLQPEPSRFFSDDRADEPVQAVEELPVPQVSPEPAWSEPVAAAAPAADRPFEVTDDLVERIARRVVELMSDQVIRSIAWEVIPDAAEIAVKERIRQLEMEEN